MNLKLPSPARELRRWGLAARRVRVRAGVLLGAGALSVVAGLTAAAQPAGATAACNSSSPASAAYTATLCITEPAGGASVTGSVPVKATVSISGTSPGVRELVFTINGSALLWDFQSPYTFTLDSSRWVDGSYALSVYAIMRDGFNTAQTTENVTFSNGVTSPPVNPASFTPTAGTSPAVGSPFVVAAAGDGASGETAEGNVANLISSWSPDLFLYLGDVYENGRSMEFDNWYGKPGAAGTYGQFYSITDPTIGNHEYIGSDISGYEWYWNNVPHYYSFNADGWHFVSLDNISKYIGNTSSNGNYAAETQWLSNDLTNNPLACTIVYYHEPLYNVGPEGPATNTSGIWQILAQHHVTLVLNGHDHDYQRWVPLDGNGNPNSAGVTEFVVGSGGHGHQAQRTTDTRLAASDFTHFGALRLALGTSGASYQFISTAGATLDSGSVPCKGGGPDIIPPSQPQNLTATTNANGQVQLAWDGSTDNVGVTAYDIYRNGALLTSSAPPPGYVDQNVEPNTTYSYYVVARDAAGNSSLQSNPATVTTPASVSMFYDGFETGDMSQWTTSTGMSVQTQTVSTGTYAAEAAAAGSPAYAYKQLPQTYPALYYSTRFDVKMGGNSIYLLRLRTAKRAAIAAVFVTSSGKLAIRNDVTGTTTTSAIMVSSGWHSVELYANPSGTSGQISVWLDGTPVSDLTGTQSLGTTPIGYLQLGDTSSGKTFDVVFDDVRADPQYIQP